MNDKTNDDGDKANEGGVFVYSTLAADMLYTNYGKGGADLPIADDGVLIKGGAGVANDRIVSPLGIMTEVSAEQLYALEQNPIFKLHKANKFIKVETKRHEVEAVVGDMQGRDVSAPLIEADFPEDGRNVKPTVAGKARK